MTTGKLLATAGILLALVSLSSLCAAQPFYSHAFLWTQTGGMQDLGTIAGGQNSAGLAINRFGEVVGDASRGSQFVASRWTASLGMQPVLGFEGLVCYAVAVNGSGQIAVTCGPNIQARAYLWTPPGGMQDIGTLGGDTTIAAAMNESAEIVGTSARADGLEHAFLWTQAGGMQDLGALPGAVSYSAATSISNAGFIVGQSVGKDGTAAAVVWKAGKIKALGHGIAYGVNDAGHVVGASYTSSTPFHAFLWTPQTGMTDLGLLNGGVSALAQGINNSDEVVGYDFMPTGFRAFFWSSTAGMQDLGTLGGPNATAYAINDAGQVTGNSDVP